VPGDGSPHAVVRQPRARFAHALVGLILIEALLFDEWPAALVAGGVVALDMIVPRASPLGWAFDRVLPGFGAPVPQAAYRLSGAVVGVVIVLAVAALATDRELVGWGLAGLAAAGSVFTAVAGFAVWASASDAIRR